MEFIREMHEIKHLTFKVKDTYLFALHLLDASKKLGKIKEKKNEVLIKGPRKEIRVEYVIVEQIDRFHKVICNVRIHAADLSGNVNIELQSIVKIWEVEEHIKGFFSNLIHMFYKKDVKPLMLQLAEERAKHISKMIIKFAKELAK